MVFIFAINLVNDSSVDYNVRVDVWAGYIAYPVVVKPVVFQLVYRLLHVCSDFANQSAQPDMASVMMKQGTPSHFQCNGGNVKWRFAKHDIRIIFKYLCGLTWQCRNQILTLGYL